MRSSRTPATELSRSVLVRDRGRALTALEEEVRLVQPDVRVVHMCDSDTHPVSLDEVDAAVRAAARRSKSQRLDRTGLPVLADEPEPDAEPADQGGSCHADSEQAAGTARPRRPTRAYEIRCLT
jgi:hypothetical protein